jgi:hypothetical protein
MTIRDEIEAACQRWTEMSRAGEWRRMPSFFTEDASLMNCAIEEPIVGRDAIATWVETWADYGAEVDVEWVAIDGDRVAVGWREQYPLGQHRGILTLIYGGGGMFSSYETFFDMKRLEALTAQ